MNHDTAQALVALRLLGEAKEANLEVEVFIHFCMYISEGYEPAEAMARALEEYNL